MYIRSESMIRPIDAKESLRISVVRDGDDKAVVITPLQNMMHADEINKSAKKNYRQLSNQAARRFFGQEGFNNPYSSLALMKFPVYLCNSIPSLSSLEEVDAIEVSSNRSFKIKTEWLSNADQSLRISSTIPMLSDWLFNESESTWTFSQKRMNAMLSNLTEIPAMNETLQELIMIKMDYDALTEDLVACIKSDMALSAQVLKFSNSSFYAYPREVTSIEDAVSLVLGFDNALSLALNVKYGDLLKSLKSKSAFSGIIASDHWIASSIVAETCQIIAKKIVYKHKHEESFSGNDLISKHVEKIEPATAFVAGLLHNIGASIMYLSTPERYIKMINSSMSNPHIPLRFIQSAHFDFTSESVGSLMLKRWGMPSVLSDSVANIHNVESLLHKNQDDPDGSDGKELSLVYAAITKLAINSLIEKGMIAGALEDSSSLRDLLNYRNGDIDNVAGSIKENYTRIISMAKRDKK